MSLRKFCNAIFTKDTQEEFLRHPTRMGHSNKIHKYVAGDIAVCYNQETKVIFGIVIFIAIDKGKIYKKTDIHPYDQAPYTNAQYNNYEIGVKFYPIDPVSVETINIECGIDPGTQLTKVMYKSFNGDCAQIAPWINRVLLECLIDQV